MRIRVIEKADLTVAAFIAGLEQRRWEDIGACGAFASVFIRGDLVWRVEHQEAGQENYDYACGSDCREIEQMAHHCFVMAVATGKIAHGPHIPHFKVQVILADGVATLMERLEASLGDRPQPGAIAESWALEGVTPMKCKSPLAQTKLGRVESYLAEVPRSFEAAILRVTRWARRAGLNEDLHAYNMMWRRDGMLVITDPVW